MAQAVAVERTLVLLKPDAVGRGLVGEIISRFERKGLELAGLKLVVLDRAAAEEHYAEHKGKPFYDGLVDFVTSGPLVAAVMEGRGAVQVVRAMVGATSGQDALPGTIRGDFGVSDRYNLVHASDGPESAAREIARFFSPGELVDREMRAWIYDLSGGAPL
ncbi:MAG: nucleoside-diphosphate kinase [Planctomycetota bacterium]|jgi:nucleoside-diphosphate kinase